MKRLVLLAIATAMAATGCGHPLIPAAYTKPTVPSVSAKAKAAATAPQSVIGKQRKGAPLVGVNLFAIGDHYSEAQVELDGERTLPYIKDTLHGNAVDITWSLYASTDRSDTVRATADSLSAANVEIVAEMAEQQGLKVALRPIIFVKGTKSEWEGKIAPANSARWFNSYYKTELPYLKVAQKLHVTEFVVSTEMGAMDANPGWHNFFKRLAKVYHGTLNYASWEKDYFPSATRHLQPLANVGMDMYEPAHIPASSSEGRVLSHWEHFFNEVPASVRKRTTIWEMGIEARRGAYLDPSILDAKGTRDEKVQVNWFKAACESVRKYHLAGLFFWKVDLNDNPAYPSGAMSNFEGTAGGQVIADCASIIG